MTLPNQLDECLLCGSDILPPLTGYEQYHLVRCSNCQFVFCKQKPSLDELTRHYASYPRGNAISKITLKRYNSLLDSFEGYRKTNNIIDIGCGDGFFLGEAKKRGWNVFGTEFTQEAIATCQLKGIQMNTSPLNATNYEP